MNFEYLQSFHMTVKHESMSKAADALHLSLPGLSKQLKKLEKELGVKVVIRSNKGVRLTEAGKILYKYSDTFLSLDENIQRDIENLRNNKQNLIVGCHKSIGEDSLPCCIYNFKKNHEEIGITIEAINCTEIIKKLSNHSINIGIIKGEPRKNNISKIYINSDEFILVGSKNNNNLTISIDELKEIPLICRENTSYGTYILEEAFEKKGMSLANLNIIYNLNSSKAIKSSVSSGKGFAFLPRSLVKKDLNDGTLSEIKVNGIEIKFNHYIVFRKNYTFTPSEKMFIDFISKEKDYFC